MWGGAWMFRNWMSFANIYDHDVYAVNLRGHRESRACDIGKVGIEDYIDDAREVVQLIGERPIIVGHSLGGLIAQVLAHQGLAEKVALVNPIPPRQVFFRGPIVRTLLKWPYLKKILHSQPLLISYKDALSLGGDNPNFWSFYHQLVPDSGRVIRQIALGKISVPNLHCPGIILAGLKDKITTPKMQQMIARHLKVPIKTYPNHGHLMMFHDDWRTPIRNILDFAT